MKEYRIGEYTYRSRQLSANDQSKVARRLAPLLTDALVGVMPIIFAKLGEGMTLADIMSLPVEELATLATPLANALGKLSDADHDTVLGLLMSVVERKGEGGVWAPVWNLPAGMAMFQDINKSYALQLKIVGPALWENLGDFFSELLSGLSPE
jgi:hypothetical protein